MFNLVRAEWFKLVRRPMPWMLLIIVLLLMLLYLVLTFVIVGLHDGTFSGRSVQIRMLRDEQLEQMRLQLQFPGIFGTVLSSVNSFGGICAIVLAAGAIGSEYNWGTLRTHLARQPQRGRYLIAKISALVLVLLAGIMIILIVGTLLGLVFALLLGNVGNVSLHDFLILPLAIVRSLFVMLPYLMFTIACCVLGRSVLAGAAGGLIFLTFDLGVGGLSFLSQSGGMLTTVYNLFAQPNVTALVMLNSNAYGLDPAVSSNLNLSQLPSPLQATLVVACYSLLFFWIRVLLAHAA